MTTVDPYLLRTLFHELETPEGKLYWRECVGHAHGYLVVYPDGKFVHTLCYPGPARKHAYSVSDQGIVDYIGYGVEVPYTISIPLGVPIVLTTDGNVRIGECKHEGAVESVGPTTDQINGWCAKCNTGWTRWPERK